jgi:hypothetical protein
LVVDEGDGVFGAAGDGEACEAFGFGVELAGHGGGVPVDLAQLQVASSVAPVGCPPAMHPATATAASRPPKRSDATPIA